MKLSRNGAWKKHYRRIDPKRAAKDLVEALEYASRLIGEEYLKEVKKEVYANTRGAKNNPVTRALKSRYSKAKPLLHTSRLFNSMNVKIVRTERRVEMIAGFPEGMTTARDLMVVKRLMYGGVSIVTRKMRNLFIAMLYRLREGAAAESTVAFRRRQGVGNRANFLARGVGPRRQDSYLNRPWIPNVGDRIVVEGDDVLGYVAAWFFSRSNKKTREKFESAVADYLSRVGG